jgi:hypothetical protein
MPQMPQEKLLDRLELAHAKATRNESKHSHKRTSIDSRKTVAIEALPSHDVCSNIV